MERKKYKKESWTDPRIEVRESRLGGKGLFAKIPIKTGEVVVVWGGEFTDEEGAKQAREKGRAVQQIGENLFDVFDYQTRNEDPTYNHNHSCDPNTWMQDEVTIVARRDISPNEELTIDYALFVMNERYVMPGHCRCGSTLCRRIITGKDWRKGNLQERYKGHFSPYLNERILKLMV